MRQPEQRSSVKSGCLLRGLAAIGHDAGALAIAAASAKITRSAASWTRMAARRPRASGLRWLPRAVVLRAAVAVEAMHRAVPIAVARKLGIHVT
jgi:hypothetical protein